MAGRSKKPLPLPLRIETPAQVTVTTPGNLERRTTVKLDDRSVLIDPDDVEVLKQLGRGAYGIVEKVRHNPSGLEMALKRITAVSQEQRQLLMDMDVLVKGMACPSIVKFHGALFCEGDLWLFMEIMDTSLDKFYRAFYKDRLDDEEPPLFPERVLGKITSSVVSALHYLHCIKIIHRDVKPSNILINKRGDVKLCDFGIAGYLVNSIAQTYEAGCKPYMAPERINPNKERKGYDIRSDVWSLGITIVELATGKFPYPQAGNFFQQLKRVCTDAPPRLPAGRYSDVCEDFVVQCLQKDYQKRSNYSTLLEHEFITSNADADIGDFVSEVLKE